MVDQVKYADVCRVLERVEKTRGSSKKQDLLAAFFSSIPALLTGHAFPLLRLLLPKFDREKAYGISVKKIAALYVEANSWPAQGQKATRLFQWADKKHSAKASVCSASNDLLDSNERGLGYLEFHQCLRVHSARRGIDPRVVLDGCWYQSVSGAA